MYTGFPLHTIADVKMYSNVPKEHKLWAGKEEFEFEVVD